MTEIKSKIDPKINWTKLNERGKVEPEKTYTHAHSKMNRGQNQE